MPPGAVRECPDSRLRTHGEVPDFFSISGCRDLLFHVQEHRLALPDIAAFIAANNLQFLGFALDPLTRRNYARRFPRDPAMTDMAQWHQYEIENPGTFIGCYQFWVQTQSPEQNKTSSSA